jgi:hypothetical protein
MKSIKGKKKLLRERARARAGAGDFTLGNGTGKGFIFCLVPKSNIIYRIVFFLSGRFYDQKNIFDSIDYPLPCNVLCSANH